MFHSRSFFRFIFLPLLALSVAAAAMPLNAALSVAQSEALYQEMLRDPQFKAADAELSALYTAIRKQRDPAAQSQIRDQQRAWLKSTYESIAQAPSAARAGLGERLTRERIQELRLTAQSPRPPETLTPAPPLASGSGLAKSPRGEVIDVNANLAKLTSGDPDRRLEALRELEYSLDPRLPAVMLGLLTDAGDTTRRVAAHGIGSRWWQIPKDQIGRYISELKAAEAREGKGDTGECQRSMALLQLAGGERIEYPKAVSLSPNGRWLIYDRLGLPCLIDVRTQTEEMLGMESPDREGRYWNSSEILAWHPSKESVAIPLATRRGTVCVMVWTHGAGTQVIHRDRVIQLVEKRKFKATPLMSFISEEKLKWRGDKLVVALGFSTETDDGPGREATFLWSPSSGELALESIK